MTFYLKFVIKECKPIKNNLKNKKNLLQLI